MQHKLPGSILEERGFQLMLVNARQVKILPGRKTDVADAAWLAELVEHGLLRGSFGDHHALLVHLALGTWSSWRRPSRRWIVASRR
jgi:hypothetical protein